MGGAEYGRRRTKYRFRAFPHRFRKKKMLPQFATLTGKFETLKQIAGASQWLTWRGIAKMDRLKYECFNKHEAKIDLHRAWAEIIIYRKMGQTHIFLIVRV